MTSEPQSHMHTDINQSGIIARLPQSWRPYGVLMRLDRPIGWWLLLLPGWCGMALASDNVLFEPLGFWFSALLFWIGALVMRGAGCVINDLWDRDLDKLVERTHNRPLASGDLSFMQGLMFLGSLLFLGFCILLTMNGAVIMLGLLAVPLIIIYPLMKRYTWWPQAFLGLTFNFGAMMGWAQVAGELNFAGFMLYCAGILWTLGYDTIYAHQDKEDDMVAGIKSTALYFGKDSRRWVQGFYWAAFVILTLSVLVAQGNLVTMVLLLIPAVYGWVVLQSWDENSAESSLRVFKENRNIGLLILAALGLGAVLSDILVHIF